MSKFNTSNYVNCITKNGISISGDRGKSAGFEGRCMPIFAPKKDFWKVWHSNIGKIPEEENTRYYVTEYYNEVLSQLDPQEMYDLIPKGSILLCYEDNMEFCHRHLVAFWFELFLDVSVSEVRENPRRETLTRLDRPEYLRSILEEIIKENYPMNGCDSIKDAYLSNKCRVKGRGLNLKLTS